MDDEARLGVIRRAFAQRLAFVAGVDDPGIETAFASVYREDFLGPGPWLTVLWPRTRSDEYVATPSADPAYLYMDCIFAIVPERHINNGAPSLHAKLIWEASINEGDHVVHVGPGTGYYTAIMAHLARPSGKVTAIEFDPALAESARENLSSLCNIRVVQGDGGAVPFDAADVIYVSAGATRPADAWLERAEGRRTPHSPAHEQQGLQGRSRPDRKAGRSVPDRAARRGLPGAVDFSRGNHPL